MSNVTKTKLSGTLSGQESQNIVVKQLLDQETVVTEHNAGSINVVDGAAETVIEFNNIAAAKVLYFDSTNQVTVTFPALVGNQEITINGPCVIHCDAAQLVTQCAVKQDNSTTDVKFSWFVAG